MSESNRSFIAELGDWDSSRILSVLGPTGSGKTSSVLSELRRRWPQALRHPLLVSVDSVTVYRGLDIGSAKPMGRDRDDFDWAGLDLIEPRDRLNVAEFAEAVIPAIKAARAAGRPVVLVGGSHFYERALVDGMAPGGPSDRDWLSQWRERPNAELKSRLVSRDARWESRVHVNDRYRLERFLDLAERQGFSYDELFSGRVLDGLAPVQTCALGMSLEAEELRSRLALRIEAMMSQGWIDETKRILKRWGREAPGLATVGYREITEDLRVGGSGSPEALFGALLRSHLQLAKKQRTWIRGLLKRSEADAQASD